MQVINRARLRRLAFAASPSSPQQQLDDDRKAASGSKLLQRYAERVDTDKEFALAVSLTTDANRSGKEKRCS